MKQINIYNVDWHKVLLYLIIGMLILVCTDQCNGINKRQTKIAELQGRKQTHIETIKTVYDTIKVKETKIITNTKIVYAKLDSVKQYSNTDIVSYYQKRYKSVNDIKPIELGVGFTDSIAKGNISELVKYDGVKVELKLTKDILDNTSFIVAQQDSIIDIADEQLKLTTTQLKKQRQKTTLWKIISFVAIGVGVGIAVN